MSRRTVAPQWILYLILAVFVLLAGATTVIVPICEAPDEPAHIDFVRFLRAKRHLPQQGETGEAHQPPLYYVLAALASLPADLDGLALLYRENPNRMWAGAGNEVNVFYHTAAERFPWRGAALAIHLMRALSVLMAACTVWVVYRIGREIYPHQRAVPLAAAAIVAFNPQFVFISSVVNNDNLANLCAAVALWMLVRLLVGRTGRWTLLGLGLSLAVGLMTKQNLLVLLPVAAVVLVYASFRQRSLRLLLEAGLIIGGAIVVIAGWWYVRNQMLYADPFGVNAFVAHRPHEGTATIANWGELGVFLGKMHRSLWGVFGWMTLPLPTFFYLLAAVLYLFAAIGWGMAWFRNRHKVSRQWAPWALLAPLSVVYLIWVATYGYRFGGSGWQGRYLFPALPAIALLLAGGLANLFSGRRRAIPLVLTCLTLLATTVWALFGIIEPAYVIVTRPASDLEEVQVPMDVNFGDVIRLSGYDLSIASKGAEPKLAITFYWQATGQPAEDYKVFVHLVNLEWELYGQGDGYPLDEQFPTPSWRAGDLILDTHQIQIQEPIVPGAYRIGMGWYLESTGERLPILQDGQEVGTVAETDPFEVRP